MKRRLFTPPKENQPARSPPVTGYEPPRRAAPSLDDGMAERSKALRSGRSLFGGVGSNPTLTTFALTCRRRRRRPHGVAVALRIPNPTTAVRFRLRSHFATLSRGGAA